MLGSWAFLNRKARGWYEPRSQAPPRSCRSRFGTVGERFAGRVIRLSLS